MQVARFSGPAFTVEGPGIKTARSLAAEPLPADFPERLAANRELFPRGVDVEEFVYGYPPGDSWREWFFAEFPQLNDVPLVTLPGRGTRLKGHADAIELVAALEARTDDPSALVREHVAWALAQQARKAAAGADP